MTVHFREQWRQLAGVGLAVGVLLAGGKTAIAQTTYNWTGNVNSFWSTSGNWNPAGVPGSATSDVASFNPQPLVSNIVNPNVDAPFSFQSLLIGNNAFGGGWNFTGNFPLSLSAAAAGGNLTTVGAGTYVLNGPTITGTGANNAGVTVNTSTTLRFEGTSVMGTTTGSFFVNGGTVSMDPSINRFFTTTPNPVSFVGGELRLTTAGASVLQVAGPQTNNAGFNVVDVGSNSIQFGNSGTFSLRNSTAMTVDYRIGPGGSVTYVGTPFLGANGLLANTAGGGTVGFATVNGDQWATYSGGIVAATATMTATNWATLSPATANDRVQLNAPAATTITATANLTAGSLRITPGGSGAVLDMATFNLVSNALMVTGTNTYQINGTGNFGATGTRYIYVTDPSGTLQTSLVIANGTNPTGIAGPGLVELTGVVGSQNTLSGTNRLNLIRGTLRGNDGQIGFTGAGAGMIAFRGGQLEITGGTGSNDFTRPLVATATAGGVNWSLSAVDRGSGGFSAFGSTASVNLGGSTSPLPLQWNAGGFVSDGYALVFGSNRANARINFENPIQLDNGTGYQAREVRVIAGAGGDSAALRGVISGATNADLVKTGGGVLHLTATNTYQGNTLILGGTLVQNSAASLGAATNRIIIANGATLSTQGASVTTSRLHTLGLGGGVLDVQGAGNTYQLTAAATIYGPGSLTKTGTGILNVLSANIYGGGTSINGGTFLANNSSGSATGTGPVTVNTGAILGGAGFIVPNTGSPATNTVTISGTVAPGNSSGTLTIGSSSFLSTVTASGTYEFELSTAGSSAALNTGLSSPALPHGNHDVLFVFGSLDISGLTVNITSLGSTGFNPGLDYSWLIARATAGLTGTATLGTVSGADFTLGLGGFSLGTSANNLYLNYTAIPEPSAMALLSLVAVGGGVYTWRKRRQEAEAAIQKEEPTV
jgi:autotransporter-associated beta strand protein